MTPDGGVLVIVIAAAAAEVGIVVWGAVEWLQRRERARVARLRECPPGDTCRGRRQTR
jgi:hypothetical protein